MSEEKKPITNKTEDATVQTPEEQLAQLQNQYTRLQAEFANYKRRTEEQLEQSIQLGTSKALKAIINVLDDFTLALQNKQEGEEFHQGMEMIYAKLMSTGEDLGLERIPTVGQSFDPRLHEALLAEESDKPAQEILQELQAGYTFNGITLRTAKVKVSK